LLSLEHEFGDNIKEILDQSYDYIYLHNKDGKLLDVNKVVIENLGYLKEELLDKNVLDILFEEDKADLGNWIKEIFNTGKVRKLKVFRVKKKNGGIIYIKSNTIPLKKEGEIYAILGIGHDVTEYNEIEQKLKKNKEPLEKSFSSNNLLEAIFNQSNVMIAHMDTQFNFLRVSKAYADADKKDTMFFIGRNHFDLYPNEENKQIFRNVLETGEPYYVKAKDFKYAEHLDWGVTSWDWSLIPIIKPDGDVKSLLLTIYNVTAQKKIEEEFLKEKAFTDTALNAQRDTFFVFDPYTGKAVRWNKAFREVTGYSDEEISSMKAPESYYSEEDLKRAAEATLQIETSAETTVEMDLITKKGPSIPFEYIGSSIKDEHGNLKYIVSIGRDVTERKKAEQKLKESEERFSTAFYMNSNLCAISKVEDGTYVEVNDMFLETIQTTREDIIGKSAIDLYQDPKDRDFLIDELMEKGKVINYELNFKNMNNDPLVGLFSFDLVEMDGKQYLISIAQNITERKKAEQKLKESEEKYRILVENSIQGIAIIQDLRVMFANSAFAKILGYSIEDILTMSTEDSVKIIHPGDRELVLNRHKKRMEGILVPDRYEYRIIRKDKKVRCIEIFATVIEYKGRVASQQSFIDITDRKEAEKELKESEFKFRVLFNNSTSGIAYHKIIYDESGNPVNYEIIDVNPTYEKILSLKKEKVINKRATEIYQVSDAPYLDIFSKVAATQAAISFEAYFPPMDKHFNISVISPRKGEFITGFDDISERKNAENKLKEKSEELSALNRVITLGNESTSLQEFLEKSYDQILDIVGFDRGGIYLYDVETQHNILVFHKNVHADFVAAVEDVDISEGLFNTIFNRNDPFYIEDFSEFMEGSKELGIFSATIIPLRSKDEYVGSMNIASPDHHILSQNKLDLLVAIGKQMGIIIQKFESEKLLKESEEKFRTLSDQSVVGISIIQDSQIKYVNQRLLDYIGITRGEVEKWEPENFLNVVHPDFRVQFRDLMRTIRSDEAKTTLHEEVKMVKKNGEIFWLELYGRSIIYNGRSARMNVSVDITEKKEAEQKLKESEQKFRTITEQSYMGILIIEDWNSNFTYSNQKFADIIGYTREEIENWILEGFFKIIHPEDVEDLIELARRKYEQKVEVIKNYQFRVFKKTGEIIWLEIDSKTFPYGDGLADLATVMDITERKNAEKVLNESEEKYRKLVNNANSIIIRLDKDANILFINEYGERFFEYNKDEILGRNVIGSIAPKTESSGRDLQLMVNEVFKHPEKYKTNENENITKSGKKVWISWANSAIKDENNNFIGILSVGNDITEKRITEQKLKESEEKFRNIFEQSTNAIILFDFTGKIVECNSSTETIFGYSKDELIGQNYLQLPFYSESMIKTLKKRFQAITSEASVKPQELEIKKKDGTTAIVRTGISYVTIEEEKFFQAILQDITEQKKAEQQLKKSEEKYRDLVNNIHEVIFELDENGNVEYMSPQIYEISGYRPEEQIGINVREFIHPDDLELALITFNKILQSGEFQSVDFRRKHKNGHYIYVNSSGRRVKISDEYKIIGITQDITERKKAEELIKEENKRLLELDKMRNEIINRVSHELKTPLTSMFGATQLLLSKSKGIMSDDVSEIVEYLNKGCLRLTELVVNFIDISKLDANKFELRIEKANIVDIIQDSVKELSYLAESRNQNLELNLPDEFVLEVDKIRIGHAITNLVSNAVKNTPPAGKIYIDFTETDNYIDIIIKDTGVGITKNEGEKLFQKFGKIERYGMNLDVDIEGSGLGLYISKEIVEMHNGNIFVESEGRNKGSIFTIRLFK